MKSNQEDIGVFYYWENFEYVLAYLSKFYTELLTENEISDEELHRLSREAGKIEYSKLVNEPESNFGDLDKIEEYLLSLQPIKKEESVEIKEPYQNEVIEKILDNPQPEEVVDEGVNDGIKRLVYSGRNG